MKDFLFVFRSEPAVLANRSPEEMQANTQRWMDWIGSIAAQDKLTDRGNRLDSKGKVVKGPNLVTDGPYTELKEIVGGYSIVKVASFEEAVELAKGCRIYAVGGSVEIREISPYVTTAK